MAKLLNTTFLVTQSAPATPSSGFGTLYAASSSLYFKNSNGINYNLTLIGSGSVSVFISNVTWFKPSNIKYIKVICAGGGGGGGSGRLNNISTTSWGGGGGAGGNINMAYFSSSSLTSDSYNIVVGTGGNGGIRRYISSSIGNGFAGSAGTNSTFSSASVVLLRGVGGVAGGAGTANATLANGGVNAAQTTASVPNPYSPFYFAGVNGGNGGVINGTAAGNAFNGGRWLSGGGGGGGINSSNVSDSGGSGSAIYNYNILTISGSPGIVPGGNGNDGAPIFDVTQLLFYSGSILTTGINIGTGGHSGAAGSSITPVISAGDGGSGSLGAGGGGGGSARSGSGTYSGAGGKGGNGFVLIFEYY